MTRGLTLDWPTELSFNEGRSIVRPIKWRGDLYTPEWRDATERHMRNLRDRAARDLNWYRFIFLHARECRWRALREVAPLCAPATLARLFLKVWVDSEDIWRERAVIREVVCLLGPVRQRLYTAADKKRFAALPDRLTIYRGAKKWNLKGMSWTLDVHNAIYFATHHVADGSQCRLDPDDVGIVMENAVSKSRVLFFTTARIEGEIVLPRFETGPISPEGSLWLAQERGAQAFTAELERQRKHLNPALVATAERAAALMAEVAMG